MRGIETMLLAAFAGLVGLGLWNARQWLPQWSPKVVNSVPRTPVKQLRTSATNWGLRSSMQASAG